MLDESGVTIACHMKPFLGQRVASTPCRGASVSTLPSFSVIQHCDDPDTGTVDGRHFMNDYCCYKYAKFGFLMLIV